MKVGYFVSYIGYFFFYENFFRIVSLKLKKKYIEVCMKS